MRGNVRVLEPGENRRKGVSGMHWAFFGSSRTTVNVIFACFAIALEICYSCGGGSCSYLKGDLIGVPLQYAGIGAVGGVVVALFPIDLNRTRRRLSLVAMAPALILFSLFFDGAVAPLCAEETLIPTFGRGKATVRLYTDYFCPPCRAMEPDVEPLLTDLVKRNRINLAFIDTPFHRHSSLYVRYYLYAMNEERGLERALATRAVLMEGARQDVDEPGRIETMLAEKGILIKPFEPGSIFEAFQRLLKEDEIESTPTCVIENAGRKEKLSDKTTIMKALRGLK